jgi:hypothetical protein
MIIGGLILLLGIRITFYQNTFDKNTTLRRIFLFSTKKKMKNLKVIAFDADDTLFIRNLFC